MPLTTFRVNSSFRKTAISAAFLLAMTNPAASAQTVSGLSGQVLDENKQPIASTVYVFAGGRTLQSLTGSAGRFAFDNLAAGTYTLCARALHPIWDDPLVKGAKTPDPFVDSCQSFDSAPASAAVTKGRVAVTNITVRRGRHFEVRVQDPHKLLLLKSERGDPLEDLFVFLTAPNGLLMRIPVTSRDSGGRSHSIVLPYNVGFRVAVSSSAFLVHDERGDDATRSAQPFTISNGSGSPNRVITIAGRRAKSRSWQAFLSCS